MFSFKGFMIFLCYYKPSEQVDNRGYKVCTAAYSPSPAVASIQGLPPLNTGLFNPGLD